MVKNFLVLVLLTVASQNLLAQLPAVGQLKPPGSLPLANGSTLGHSTLPVCSATTVSCTTPPYTFIGNGFWSNEENWLANRIPPSILPAGKSIVIKPVAGGECIVNVQQVIAAGAILTVVNHSRLVVIKNLVYQQ